MSNAQIAVWIVLVVGWLSGFYVGYQLGKLRRKRRDSTTYFQGRLGSDPR